jgi:DNA-binding SARP family transcriptional activator
MALLSVAVLGPPAVCHGGRSLAFPTRKTLAMLVYLSVERGVHPRDKLAALFWPESDEAASRSSLRTTLARLREGLEETDREGHVIVERNGAGFDFSSDFELDLHQLELAYELARSLRGTTQELGGTGHDVVSQFQDVADAWRGEFLEGFSLRDAPDFDDWASQKRETCRKRMEVVLDRLSRLYANAGSPVRAVEAVDHWLTLNPLEERAYRRLMRLHFAAGDRAAALGALETCRRVLDEELGIPPDPETLALAERVRIATYPVRMPTQDESSAPTAMPRDKPLVGRGDEFTKLVELYHAASQGRAQAVVLQGEAGIGKTHLATDFLGWAAAQGADVLYGRAFEMAAHLPYQPLVEALRLRMEREDEATAALSPVWLTELSRLLPELRDRYPELALPAGDEAAARTRLFEAFVRLGRAFATRVPLVVYVDDVQWADVASLDLLHYAGRRWAQDGTALLLIFCMRFEALTMTPVLDEWLQGLRRDLPVVQIDLGPLSFENTVQLLRALGQEPSFDPESEDFAQWIFEETRGQPFYIVETLRAFVEHDALTTPQQENATWRLEPARSSSGSAPRPILPAGVRQIIQARLAPLSDVARQLLAAGAVLGQGFTFDLLCTVGHLSEDEALVALDTVVRGKLLQELGKTEYASKDDQYMFAHDKIRDVVYTEAGGARRRVFHRRALSVLEAAGAPAAELARHALASGLDEQALRFSVAAGDEAMRLLAARDAAAHYERAISLAQRLGDHEMLAELHAQRGHAFVSAGMWREARSELEAALAGFNDVQRDRYAEILTEIAEACWWMLDIPSIRHYATEAITIANELERGDIEIQAIAWLAAVEGSGGNLVACLEQNQRAMRRARMLGIAPPAITGHYYPITLYWLGRLDEAVEASREAVAVAQEENDLSWLMSSLPHLGMALAGTGRYAEALHVFDDARKMGRDYRLDTLLARAIAMSAGFHLDIFDFPRAANLAQEARDLAQSLNFSPPAVSAGIDLLLTWARQQDVGRADSLVEEVASAAERTAGFHGWLWKLRLAEARAEIALARDRPQEALGWADEAIEQSRIRGRAKYQVLGLVTRAQALIGLGRTREAIADLRAALALAHSIGDSALLLRAAAGLIAIDGDDVLAAEARRVVDRIVEALPNSEMKHQFESAALTRLVLKHSRGTPKDSPTSPA